MFTTKLPEYVPPQVKNSSLKENLNLLDDETLKRVVEDKSHPPGHRYSKVEMKLPYGVYSGNEGPAVIYNDEGKQVEIGKGGNGSVKIAVLPSGVWKAIKTQRFYHSERSKKNFLKECKTLFTLGKTKDPEGIIRGDKGSIEMDLETGVDIFSWLEMRNTPSPFSNITHPAQWPELIWIDIAIKIANTIKYEIHDKGFFSIDIKLENFMFDLARPGKVGAVDFGYAEAYKIDEKGQKSAEYLTVKGTPMYVAPELNKAFRPIYNEATEVYALGKLYQLALLNDFIIRKEEKHRPILEKESEIGVPALIKQMMDDDPSKRPTMEKVIQNLAVIRQKFLKKYPDSESQAQEVYEKARDEEVRRLMAIHLKKPSSLTSIAQLKKFILEAKDEKSIILQIEAMRKSGFNFSEQNKKELLFFLIIPVLNHKYFQVLAALPKNGVDLSMEEPESGKTPAICAAKGGLSTALSKLSELGVDVNAANSQSHTAAYFAQAELLTAITEEQRSKYSNVLIALNQACINQTDEEHRKAQSSVCSFFPRMTYEARLKNNLMKAGLGKYDSLVEHASRVVYA